MVDIFERIDKAPSQFPEHGLIAVESPLHPLFFGVRKAVLPQTFPYVVFFYVRQDAAVVMALAHCRRRPSYWSRRS